MGVDYENHTIHPSVGDILCYPGGYSETETIFAYGSCSFSSKLGQLAGNHFPADEVLRCGGVVVGVINQRLHERGHLHPRLTRHEIVPDMRARKARMAELSDACIALPGGLGTLEELFEMATLTQLGDHVMACGALDTRGFYDPMRAMRDRGVAEGFLKAEHRDMIVIDPEPAALLDRLASWELPTVSKWIEPPAAPRS